MRNSYVTTPYMNMINDLIYNHSRPIIKNDLRYGNSQMTLLIQGNQWPREAHDNFILGLGTFTDLYELVNSGIKIFPGYKYKLQVYATQTVASQTFHTLDLNVRKCQYPYENPFGKKSLFQYYSQKSCVFECKLRRCEKAMKCSPWFLPSVNDTLPLCDSFWTFAFQNYMQADHEADCEICLPDCEEISFLTIEMKEKLDAKGICGDVQKRRHDETFFNIQQAVRDKLTREKVFLWRLKGLLRSELDYFGPNWPNLLLNESTSLKKGSLEYQFACEDVIKTDISLIDIEMMQNKMQRILKQHRVQFSDKLGTLGGTLGLFTGMSFIGIVEIVFLLFKLFKHLLRVK